MYKYLKIICMIFALAFLAACSTDEPHEAALYPEYEIDYTPITMAWWGSQTRHDRTLEVIRMFEEQNPHIRIYAEYFDFDGYFTNLRARIDAGEVWDIMQHGGTFSNYLDNILYLDDLIERGIIDISQTTDEAMSLAISGSYVAGIPIGINAWGIAYDAVMFRELGLPQPHPFWSWEEFVTAAMTISENIGGWGIGQFPQDGVGITQYLSQKGTPFFHTTDIHQLNIESYEPMITFLQMMYDLVATGATPNPQETLDIPTVEEDPLVFRMSGMTYIASNQFIALANRALDLDPTRELAMMMLPGNAYGGAGALSLSQMFSISNQSEHPEYAAAFIDFFVNDIDANLVLMGERGVPIMAPVREAVEAAADPVLSAVNAFISDIAYIRETIMEEEALGIGTGIFNPARGRIEEYMSTTIERVILGMMTPEEGAQAIFYFALAAIAEN